MNLFKKRLGSAGANEAPGAKPGTLTMRYDALLGIIVWIQASGLVEPESHAAALEFFCRHNPQTRSVFKKRAKQAQLGIVKIDKPKDEFRSSVLDAAGAQAKDLTPCVLVVQHGTLQSDDHLTNQTYMVCSFFRGPGPANTVVIPQPGAQIVLK